jgi:hypothetical protein
MNPVNMNVKVLSLIQISFENKISITYKTLIMKVMVISDKYADTRMIIAIGHINTKKCESRLKYNENDKAINSTNKA